MNNLGIMFLEGQGIPKNEAEGYRWIRMAAEKGDPRASYLCGLLLCQGRGVSTNSEEGIQWLKKSAAMGNSTAEAKLGQDYLIGDDGVKKDPEAAFPLIKKAAEMGSPWACAAMGHFYFYGQHVAIDNKKAIVWLKKSIDLGEFDACGEFGDVLLQAGDPYYAFIFLNLAKGGSYARLNMALSESVNALTESQIKQALAETDELRKKLKIAKKS
jgi:TPR repeat protein